MRTPWQIMFGQFSASMRVADLLDMAVIGVIVYVGLGWFRRRGSRPLPVGAGVCILLYLAADRLDMVLTSMLFQVGFTAVLLALIVVRARVRIRDCPADVGEVDPDSSGVIAVNGPTDLPSGLTAISIEPTQVPIILKRPTPNGSPPQGGAVSASCPEDVLAAGSAVGRRAVLRAYPFSSLSQQGETDSATFWVCVAPLSQIRLVAVCTCWNMATHRQC